MNSPINFYDNELREALEKAQAACDALAAQVNELRELLVTASLWCYDARSNTIGNRMYAEWKHRENMIDGCLARTREQSLAKHDAGVWREARQVAIEVGIGNGDLLTCAKIADLCERKSAELEAANESSNVSEPGSATAST